MFFNHVTVTCHTILNYKGPTWTNKTMLSLYTIIYFNYIIERLLLVYRTGSFYLSERWSSKVE